MLYTYPKVDYIIIWRKLVILKSKLGPARA